MRTAVRTVALVALVVTLASSAGCGVVSRSTPRGQPSQTVAREDDATRASFRAYFRSHVWDIKRPLLIVYGGGSFMTTAQAQASTFTSPTPVWHYNPALVSTAAPDPWRGLVPPGLHEYVFDVISSGTPVATMKIWDMPHYWVPFVVREAPLVSPARDRLDRYFKTTDYEFAYVEQGSVWGLGRRGGRVAGILIDPWGESHRTGTPKGVQTGRQLVWWLAHPTGP